MVGVFLITLQLLSFAVSFWTDSALTGPQSTIVWKLSCRLMLETWTRQQ